MNEETKRNKRCLFNFKNSQKPSLMTWTAPSCTTETFFREVLGGGLPVRGTMEVFCSAEIYFRSNFVHRNAWRPTKTSKSLGLKTRFQNEHFLRWNPSLWILSDTSYFYRFIVTINVLLLLHRTFLELILYRLANKLDGEDGFWRCSS